MVTQESQTCSQEQGEQEGQGLGAALLARFEGRGGRLTDGIG